MKQVTQKMFAEIAGHEAAVREAYLDSVGVRTWGIGVTSASGHNVERYIGNPQSMEKVLDVYQWLLREKYLPDVLEAFQGCVLQEHELAAALSFHYNTGGIKRASWVKHYKAGNLKAARKAFMSWRKPAEIIPRRQAECDLFFDAKWDNDGTITEYTKVTKSGRIVWSSAKRVKLPIINIQPKTKTPVYPAAKPKPQSGGILAALLSLFGGRK